MAAQPATALPIHSLDVETYNRMVASGALEDQRVELLDGMLVDMSPQSPTHAAVIRRLAWHFARTRFQVQLPIEVPPGSEPEPDLAVIAREPPAGQHPGAALLVIEVAVSSQRIDRGVKAQLYSRAGIQAYWLVDVPARAIEVRTQPGPGGYAHCETYREGTIVPCPLEGVDDLDVVALLADVDKG